ncbi:MAG: anti-sigma factor, partial [Pseudolabrys sp.]
MSETFDHNGLPDDELLAAELALGVLEGAERATAERRATRDRGFARLVEDWEHRLTPWAAEIAEISPPPQV